MLVSHSVSQLVRLPHCKEIKLLVQLSSLAQDPLAKDLM